MCNYAKPGMVLKPDFIPTKKLPAELSYEELIDRKLINKKNTYFVWNEPRDRVFKCGTLLKMIKVEKGKPHLLLDETNPDTPIEPLSFEYLSPIYIKDIDRKECFIDEDDEGKKEAILLLKRELSLEPGAEDSSSTDTVNSDYCCPACGTNLVEEGILCTATVIEDRIVYFTENGNYSSTEYNDNELRSISNYLCPVCDASLDTFVDDNNIDTY